jgi:hypothetical protein
MERNWIRDVTALAVPRVGRVEPTGDVALPYRLLDADSVEVASVVSEFLRDMLGNDASTGSLRSYCYELLGWFRFLLCTRQADMPRLEAAPGVCAMAHAMFGILGSSGRRPLMPMSGYR